MSDYHVRRDGDRVELEVSRRGDVLLTVFLGPEDAAEVASKLFREATQAAMYRDGVKGNGD